MPNNHFNSHELLANLNREVHVWTAIPAAFEGTAVATDYHALLADAEKAQYLRFHFDNDRYHYLIAHLLVRFSLSQYLDILPQDWRFIKAEKGKPQIDPACCSLPLRFNLTHTDGLVACAVSLDRDIGLDAENIGRVKDPVQLSSKIFTTDEQATLRSLSGCEQDEYFCSLWVLKESYVKGIGAGIGFGVEKLDFTFVADSVPQVRFIPETLGTPADWQFGLFRPTAQHCLAIAFHKGDEDERALVFKEGLKSWV